MFQNLIPVEAIQNGVILWKWSILFENILVVRNHMVSNICIHSNEGVSDLHRGDGGTGRPVVVKAMEESQIPIPIFELLKAIILGE